MIGMGREGREIGGQQNEDWFFCAAAVWAVKQSLTIVPEMRLMCVCVFVCVRACVHVYVCGCVRVCISGSLCAVLSFTVPISALLGNSFYSLSVCMYPSNCP